MWLVAISGTFLDCEVLFFKAIKLGSGARAHNHRVVGDSCNSQPIRAGQGGCTLEIEAGGGRVPKYFKRLSVHISSGEESRRSRRSAHHGSTWDTRGLWAAKGCDCRIGELAVADLNAVDVVSIDFV